MKKTAIEYLNASEVRILKEKRFTSLFFTPQAL
jgi:hypothetical protein